MAVNLYNFYYVLHFPKNHKFNKILILQLLLTHLMTIINGQIINFACTHNVILPDEI